MCLELYPKDSKYEESVGERFSSNKSLFYVFFCKVGIMLKDVFRGFAGSDKVDNYINRNPGAADNWLSKHNFRVDFNSISLGFVHGKDKYITKALSFILANFSAVFFGVMVVPVFAKGIDFSDWPVVIFGLGASAASVYLALLFAKRGKL